jgi:hypothetical protein
MYTSDMKLLRAVFRLIVPLAAVICIPVSILAAGPVGLGQEAPAVVAGGPVGNPVELSSRSAQNVGATTVVVTKSKPWDHIESSTGRLLNNVWGAAAGETFKSGVFLNPDGTVGWYWDRQDPQIKPGSRCVEPLYPGLRFGGSPWDATTSAQFPVKLESLNSLSLAVAYKQVQASTGSYDVAYDIFLPIQISQAAILI